MSPSSTPARWDFRHGLFIVAAIACATPWSSPPIALAVGIVLALAGLAAFEKGAKKLSRVIIQVCVVLLGLRIDLMTLAREAGGGFLFAAATIVGAFVLGFGLEKLLRTGKELTLLVSSGTAICGGSAIAAVGTSIGASSSAMAVATGAIFILNAVALYVFPLIGHALHLTDAQFGTWAGVAIHDVSSVVGAASSYHSNAAAVGSTALDTANVIKLTRVLWILPCALFASWVIKRERGGATHGSAPFPWFILLFLLASAVRTFVPRVTGVGEEIKFGARLGFQVALFLIGAGLSRSALRSVGWRVLTQAVIQWIVIAGVSLMVVMA
ncbi:MAG: YeiH family protein [Tepidisphaeraceae bacterium]